MRLNVLVLACVFALLAVFYGRQLSTAHRVQGMPAGLSAGNNVAPTLATAKLTQPTTAPPPVVAEKPAPGAAASAPESKTAVSNSKPTTAENKPSAAESKPPVSTASPPTAENKPAAADNKAQAPENKPPTSENRPPVVAATPAPDVKPPTPVSKPPVPPTKPAPRPTPPPPKVATKAREAAEKVAQSIITLKQIAQALQSYFRATNRYPTELGELTPKYLGAIPLDPCTGRPYYYIPVNTPPTDYILTTGRYPTGSLCRNVSPGLSYTTQTGIQNSP